MKTFLGCLEAEFVFSAEEDLLHSCVLDTILSQSHDEGSSSHSSHDQTTILDVSSSSS